MISPFQTITGTLIKQASGNTIWGPMIKYNMGQKQNIRAEANAENINGTHDESHGGGGRPPHIMCRLILSTFASACILCFAPFCIFSLGLIMYCIAGPAGAINPCFSASLNYPTHDQPNQPFRLDAIQGLHIFRFCHITYFRRSKDH